MCGYLPLAVGMLASQLRHHPAWSAAGLAADLAAAKDRLALMRAENLSVAAAFDLSYADLTAGPQRLFRLGLVPGPSFDGYAAAALDGTSAGEARRHLGELYDQHLITEPAPGRYQLHDLLREHARALAAAGDPAGSDAAADRLLDYYLHAVLAAASTSRLGYRPPPPAGCLLARRCPGSVHARAGGRMAGSRAPEPGRRGRLRRRVRAASARHADPRRDEGLPRCPRSLGSGRRSPSDRPDRGPPGRRPARPRRRAPPPRRDGNVYRELHRRRRQLGPGGHALRSYRRPAGQAYALCQQGIMQRWTGNYAAALATIGRRWC